MNTSENDFRKGVTGIYKGIPSEEYYALEAVSNSALSILAVSPAHYKAAVAGLYSRTVNASMNVGTAFEDRFFRADTYRNSYVERPPNLDRRRKAHKEVWNDLVERFGEDKILTTEQMFDIEQMYKNLRYHSDVDTVFNQYNVEDNIHIIWEDGETGLLCKAEMDAFVQKIGLVIDVKTTSDASDYGFAKSYFQYNYYRQAAWYTRGLEHHGYDSPAFRFWVVETSIPYCSRVMRPSPEDVKLANYEIDKLLDTLVDAQVSDDWKGYPERLQIELPSWARAEIRSRIT